MYAHIRENIAVCSPLWYSEILSVRLAYRRWIERVKSLSRIFVERRYEIKTLSIYSDNSFYLTIFVDCSYRRLIIILLPGTRYAWQCSGKSQFLFGFCVCTSCLISLTIITIRRLSFVAPCENQDASLLTSVKFITQYLMLTTLYYHSPSNYFNNSYWKSLIIHRLAYYITWYINVIWSSVNKITFNFPQKISVYNSIILFLRLLDGRSVIVTLLIEQCFPIFLTTTSLLNFQKSYTIPPLSWTIFSSSDELIYIIRHLIKVKQLNLTL